MEKQKLEILKSFLGSHYRSGDEHLFFCPQCDHHKKKLSVNLQKDKFKCWICDYRGNSIKRLVRQAGRFPDLKAWEKFSREEPELVSFEEILYELQPAFDRTSGSYTQETSLPQEFISLVNPTGSLTEKAALGFLYKRGIKHDDILKWKIGHCSQGEYAGRIIIPSFNDDGAVNYFVARSYNGHYQKYMNPPVSKNIVFNELYVDWTDDVVVVEGAFDAIKAGNAIPILGTTLQEGSKLFSRLVKSRVSVYLALDADAEKKAARLIGKLSKYGVKIYKVDISPYADAGEMTKEEFEIRKGDAKLIRFSENLSAAIASI